MLHQHIINAEDAQSPQLLEEEKAQKSFYQAKHKEVSAELQNKTSQLEEAKKKVIALGKIHQHENTIALAVE